MSQPAPRAATHKAAHNRQSCMSYWQVRRANAWHQAAPLNDVLAPSRNPVRRLSTAFDNRKKVREKRELGNGTIGMP